MKTKSTTGAKVPRNKAIAIKNANAVPIVLPKPEGGARKKK